MSALTKESNALYTKCLKATEKTEEGMRMRFSQQDLEALVDYELPELMNRITELVDHSLFRTIRVQQQILWLIRSRETAASMAGLTESERMVFGIIEDADRVGIWIKRIKTLTNAPPNEVQKAVTKLERLGHVKGIRSIKAPAQRMYMLAHLAPSDEVTGGSFFDAGELDESLVDELCNLIIFRVRQQSWQDVRRVIKREAAIELDLDTDDKRYKRPRQSIEDDVEQHAGASKKRKHDTFDIEDTTSLARSQSKHKASEPTEQLQLAYPAGSRDYPTAADVHDFIMTSNAMRESKKETLSIEEIQGLIDVLVWDAKLEKIRGGYRTVRGVAHKTIVEEEFDPTDVKGNGLTDVPCGRCHITNLCQEGTRVSAATCVYYDEWLQP